MIGTQQQLDLDNKILVDDSRTAVADSPLAGEEIVCHHCGFFFRGAMRAGCPHGTGVVAFGATKDSSLPWDKVCSFSGSFRYGRRDGPGQADVCRARMKLDGCWKNDRLNGPVSIDVSEMEKSNLALFRGDLGDSNASMEGSNCVLQWKNGVTYKGGLRRGQRAGEGTMYLYNEPVLKCQWDADQPQGFAHRFYLYFRKAHCSVRRVQDASAYKALFVGSVSKGRLGPFGRLYDEDNTRKTLFYEGQWFNDLPEGRGMMVLPEGVYEGSFCEGLRSGDGILKCTTASTALTISGHWADDQLVQLFSISTRDSASGDETLCDEFHPPVGSSKKIASILATSSGIRRLSPSLLREYHLCAVVEEELPTASADLDHLEKEISALRGIWRLNFWDRHLLHSEDRQEWKPVTLDVEILRAGGLAKEGRNLCKAVAKRPSSEVNGFKCVCTYGELVRETCISKSMNSGKGMDVVEWNEVVVFSVDAKGKNEDILIQIYARIAEMEYLLGSTLYPVNLHAVNAQNRSIMAQTHIMGSFLKGCIIGSLFLTLTFS